MEIEKKTREKLLLHACCAPCLLSALFHLKNEYEITVFYCNPNIYPKEEYVKRMDYTKQLCEDNSLNFVEAEYEHSQWLSFVARAKNFQNLPEGDERCMLCFEFRMRKTAEYAKEHSFTLFATTLSSGSNKKAEKINEAGKKIASESALKYIGADFKKGGGYEFSRKECKRLDIYRQNYCGCEFSFRKII